VLPYEKDLNSLDSQKFELLLRNGANERNRLLIDGRNQEALPKKENT